jgi:integrase
MPRPRSSKLESATARLRLPVRKKPYAGPSLARGIKLLYRRNRTNGRWIVKASGGHGSYWTKGFAEADDYERADGKTVLTFYQAQDAAKALARRQPGVADDESRPITISEALDRYARDLAARGGNVNNARRARIHLTPALLSKPVALVGANELKRWRDGLTAKGLKPASVNRTRTCLRAALELAAAHDPRIANQHAWKTGLAGLPDAHRARNVILDDATVRRVIEAAYAHDRALGLLTEVAATTGARLSQLARLEVADLQADRARLLMPLSAKGRVRSTKRLERRPVPITPALAAVLKQKAAGRPSEAPLLLRSNGKAWGYGERRHHRDDFRAVVVAAGLDPDAVTLYALRHSNIVRQLLANVPIRVVATLHDTSTKMIEANYSRYIAEHTDEIARRALLDVSKPATANVIPLSGR